MTWTEEVANNDTRPDVAQLVASLNADEIRNRLDEIDRERGALMVLLRVAIKNEPKRQRPARNLIDAQKSP